MKDWMRFAAVEALDNDEITDDFIEDCIKSYESFSDMEISLKLDNAKKEFSAAGGRGVELADTIDQLRVALAIRGWA